MDTIHDIVHVLAIIQFIKACVMRYLRPIFTHPERLLDAIGTQIMWINLQDLVTPSM